MLQRPPGTAPSKRDRPVLITLAGTQSVGVALLGPDTVVASAATMIAVADQALYRAKAAGRDCAIACAVTSDVPKSGAPPRTQPPST